MMTRSQLSITATTVEHNPPLLRETIHCTSRKLHSIPEPLDKPPAQQVQMLGSNFGLSLFVLVLYS